MVRSCFINLFIGFNLLIIPCHSLNGLQLSNQSRKAILSSALHSGVIAGSVSGLFNWFIGNNLKSTVINSSIAAGIIAAIAALVSSGYTPEAYYEYAQDEYEKIINGDLYSLLQHNALSVVDYLQDYYSSEQFPLKVSFDRLKKLHDTLKDIRESFEIVNNSYLVQLKDSCSIMIAQVSHDQKHIIDVLKLIKALPAFMQEVNAHYLQHLTTIQQQAADAACIAAANSFYNYEIL